MTSRTSSPIEPEIIDRRGTSHGRPVEIKQLEFLARLMDSVFEISGLKIRFGLDGIFGLLSGFGGFATSLVTLYIIQEAHRRGVSRLTLARMGMNTMIDWALGTIPVVGDAFDVYWKANQKNVELLKLHAADPATRRKQTMFDWLFLVALIGGLIVFLVGSVTITYWLLISLFRLVMQN